MEMRTARASRPYLGRGSARDARCYTGLHYPTLRLRETTMADKQFMNLNAVPTTTEVTTNGREPTSRGRYEGRAARSTQDTESHRRDACSTRRWKDTGGAPAPLQQSGQGRAERVSAKALTEGQGGLYI